MNTIETPTPREEGLIQGTTGELVVSIGANAWTEHNAILGRASLIGRVANAKENERCAKIMQAIKEFEDRISEAHQVAKKPAWDYCVKLDETKRDLLKKLKAEAMRLAKLSGDYLALEEAKTRAANNVRNEQITELEREREAELSRVSSHEEREIVQEHYNARAAALPKAETQKAKGQSLDQDWDLEIIDVVAFVSNHPAFAKVEIKLREAKAWLKGGQTLKGVQATPSNKAKVKAPKPIDVETQTVPSSPASVQSSVQAGEAVLSQWIDTPNSSQILRIGYDPDQSVMQIVFKNGGNIYDYFQVPAAVFEGFRTAPSAGIYFGKTVKGVFAFKKRL